MSANSAPASPSRTWTCLDCGHFSESPVVRDLHADMYGHSWRANDHAPASPSVSPIAEAPEATPRFDSCHYELLLECAKRYADQKRPAGLSNNEWLDMRGAYEDDAAMLRDVAEFIRSTYERRAHASLAQRSDDSPSVLSEEDAAFIETMRNAAGRGSTFGSLDVARLLDMIDSLRFRRLTSGGSDDRAGVGPAGDVLTRKHLPHCPAHPHNAECICAPSEESA